MLQKIRNLKRAMFDISCDIDRMRNKVYRTEQAIKAGNLPSVEIRHYCRDYGVRYNQSTADKCLIEAIHNAEFQLRIVEHKWHDARLEFEYACMC